MSFEDLLFSHESILKYQRCLNRGLVPPSYRVTKPHPVPNYPFHPPETWEGAFLHISSLFNVTDHRIQSEKEIQIQNQRRQWFNKLQNKSKRDLWKCPFFFLAELKKKNTQSKKRIPLNLQQYLEWQLLMTQWSTT